MDKDQYDERAERLLPWVRLDWLPKCRIYPDGSIWSEQRQILHRMRTSVDHKGYNRVRLTVGNKYKTFLAHRLVCEAFHGKPPAGTETRHLDGNKRNNHESNLCWGTASENAHDRKRHGTERARENGLLTRKVLQKQKSRTLEAKRSPRGDEHGSSKLSVADVKQIRKWISEGAYTSDLASLYGVSRTTIQRVVNGSLWRHVA